jgi:hypothetical protein
MNKILLVTIISALIFNNSNAQNYAIAAYAELGGAGLASANFDMRLQKKNDGLGFRVGIGGFSVTSSYSFGSNSGEDKTGITTIPLEVNYLVGKNQKNYFEMGAGATVVILKNKNSTLSSTTTERFNSSFGHLYFGYRLQPKEGGFLFRAGITPVFGRGYFLPYLPAISFGYKF